MDEQQMMNGIANFLLGMGVDLASQHLLDTPARVTRAWRDYFGQGYSQKPEDVLTTQFNSDYDGLLVIKDIPFVSHCAHHLVPFLGVAKIGYLPDKKITGLSKLARVLDVFALRLQVQEDLTQQTAQAIQDILEPKGVGVVLEAQHMCMTHRGVRKPGSNTITSCVLGEIRDNKALKQEFLSF